MNNQIDSFVDASVVTGGNGRVETVAAERRGLALVGRAITCGAADTMIYQE